MPPLAVPFDYMLMSPSLDVINCAAAEMSSVQTSGDKQQEDKGELEQRLWDFTNV